MTKASESMNYRVRELRKETLFSQSDFAKALGISHSLLSKIENDVREISPKLSQKIINTFQLNPEWFYEGKGELNFVTPSIGESVINPWKDEAYNSLKEQLDFMREQFKQLSQTHNDLIAKLGKYKAFDFAQVGKSDLSEARMVA